MAARKGWAQLSDNYRKRLLRGGINQQAYESGATLKAARGHKTPTGIGEKAYANLLKIAKGLSWHPDETPKQAVDNELARGLSPRWLRERLTRRASDTQAYRKGDRKPGRQSWDRRRLSVATELYWYH